LRKAVKLCASQISEILRETDIFEKHTAFITTPIAMLDGRDETSRIDLQQAFGLCVRIYFDILIGNFLGLKCNPYSLDKWTKKETGSH